MKRVNTIPLNKFVLVHGAEDFEFGEDYIIVVKRNKVDGEEVYITPQNQVLDITPLEWAEIPEPEYFNDVMEWQ